MSALDPLTHRSCSNCGNWNKSISVPEDDVMKALCCIDNEVRSGGYRCGNWIKRIDWLAQLKD
jgi:hypothetical protein